MVDELPSRRKLNKTRLERDLPSTTYAVLGMLTFEEMSGYGVAKLIDHSIAHFGFQPARSQVYVALRRLAELGWATERVVAQHDRPDKRLYRITAAGEQALRKWLESPGIDREVVKSPFLLKVFLGAMIPPETLLAQMKEANRQAVEELEQLEEIEREIHRLDRPDLRFPSLVLRYGLAHNRATVAWTAEMLDELQPQSPAPPRARRKRSPRGD